MSPRTLCRAAGIGAALFMMTARTDGDIIVDYTINIGGHDDDGMNGLSARATWMIDGTTLTILLENTSTSTLPGRGISDELITMLLFDLGDALIVSGESAVVGPGSKGLGSWAALLPGDSVADEWLWSNLQHDDDAGDDDFDHVISTSMGIGNGVRTDFNGDRANVGGPFGGIAPMAWEHPYHGNQHAVSNGILFTLILSEPLTDGDLESIAVGSLVGFGSGASFVAVPTPGSIVLVALGVALAGIGRLRQRV
jgi:hypothetical protein